MGCNGIAGWKAVLKVGGVTIGQARDVTADFDAGLVDTTVRADNGWQGRIPTIRGFSISGDQLYVADDAGLEVCENAALNGTKFSVSIEHESGGDGWTGFAFMASFSKGEPIADAQGFSFTMESCGEWVKIEDGAS